MFLPLGRYFYFYFYIFTVVYIFQRRDVNSLEITINLYIAKILSINYFI